MAVNFCSNCGTKFEASDRFCPECGHSISKFPGISSQQTFQQTQKRATPIIYSPPYSPPAPAHQKGPEFPYKRKTGWLTFVIVVNCFLIGILSMGAFLYFFFMSDLEAEAGSEIENYVFLFFIIYLAIIGLLIWLTVALNNYNNVARVIMIILSGIVIIGSLFTVNVITLAVNGLIIYGLGFHKETVALFTTSSGRSYQRPPRYDQRRY